MPTAPHDLFVVLDQVGLIWFALTDEQEAQDQLERAQARYPREELSLIHYIPVAEEAV